MPKTEEVPSLQVLLVETDDRWIAQGIQHDISVEADTLEDLLYEFERAMIGHYFMSRARGVTPFANMPPAPKECVELWQSGYASIHHTPEFRLVTEPEAVPPQPDYRIATRKTLAPEVASHHA